MAASSSGRRRYDVFPSFSGEDVRKSFLSHLLKELDRKSINTFIDHGIERSRLIGPELLLAIRESRISIVVFSKKYASSTWCLNELVEIHKCFKDLDQMVIPVFHTVDPSEVRKQTGDFGKVFEETCKGKPEDQKQSWMQALTDVANMAGEDLRNWSDEADMVEKIANDVSNKLITPSNGFGDFVGIEAHLEAMNSVLCLESEEVRMLGILGASGIGKSTIGGALFSQLSSQFPHRAFVSYKRTSRDDYGMKLSWAEQFLSEILGQKEMKIEHLGVVEQRLKHKKVLIVLDDVDDLELLKTLVGQTGWFGYGSRIIVITQDRRLLKSHKIDLIYEVELPSKDLALQMLCHSAFGEIYPPDGFMELATEVVTLAGNLPLGLSVIGSALKGKDKEEWIKNLPRLRKDLDGKIEKTLRVSYDRLDRKDQDLFLHIACFFNGYKVKCIKDMLTDSVNTGLTMLADKSLIRITPEETVEMHNLLQKLGRGIDRAECIGNPGKRRFLDDIEDIRNVLTDHSGTETVVGINFKYSSDINQPYVIDENSFEGMRNLQFLIVYDYNGWERDVSMGKPQGLTYLPRKLRLLNWNYCSLKCLPSNFNAEYLVELTMSHSNLEKLWEGNQSLGSLKKMDMSNCKYLKEIPDLSKAKNLEEVDLSGCTSLVTLPSSIQYVINLRRLNMQECRELESFPTHLNLESLEYLNLRGCSRLTNFPEIIMMDTPCSIFEVEDCFWNKNHPGLDYLDSLMRCMPGKLRPEYLTSLTVRGNMLEKLWKGIQSLGSLVKMDLSECENLTEVPDLSKATNLESLTLNDCKSLVTLPSTIGNLQKLVELEMEECTGLEVLPNDVNLSSLFTLNLSECSRLTSFPQISTSIEYLNLNDTAIEQVPCCIVNFSKLSGLTMCGCKRLKNVSPNIFRMTSLEQVDFSECVELVTALSGDASVVATMSMEDHLSFITLSKPEEFRIRETKELEEYFYFYNCFKLDPDARELILRSYLRRTVLPGGEVPMYFTHRASGDSLTIPVHQSSLSQEFLRFQACVVLEPLDYLDDYPIKLEVSLHFMQVEYLGYIFRGKRTLHKTDHLVLSSFKFPPELLPSKLEYYHDVEVNFSCLEAEIKECGVRLLNVFPSPEDAARCSENQQSGETRDILTIEQSDEQGRSEKLDGELLSMEEAYSDEMLSKPWTGTPSASSKSGDSDLGNDMAIVASKITTTALNNDWDSLHEFLSNHLPPLTISGCSAKDVIDFLRMQHTSGVEAAEALVGYLSATCEAHGIRPMNSSQPDEVQKWKAAMADIASIGGYEWQKGKQVLLPEEVVRDACLRLSLKNSKNLTRILAFLNHSQPSDVEIVGLWGMAGIGKTSIAREIFGILAPEYELHYFLQDFYLMCQKKGLRQMRDDFFSKVFREEKLSISACNIKPSFMRNLFRNKKILLVLDDVSDARDVEAVVGGFGWFSQGHRIILTSRRKQVLVQCKVTELYEIQKLSKFESFLLCKQYLNEESGVIMELMNWSSGIPLALKILGFSVSKQHINNMKEHLQSLRRNPPSQIQEAFRRSFDGLDENEKNIFLDLACFFRGEDKDHAVQLLDACGFLTYLGICDLIDQSLISLLDNKIEIPIPFQDIGRFIVHEEDEDPCERSRLWDSSDIADVLTNNSGTEAIEGIFLDVSDLTCELSPTVFGKMYNLRLLKLYCSTSGNECKLNLPQGLDTLPDELRLLHWENYPLEYLPREFNPENLVEINMPYSNMKTLWEGKKNLEKLKNIKLSHSRQLTDILMLSEALNLEQIDLEGCTSLIDVSISIPHLGKLVSLNMKDCCRLQSLPSMVDLTSLKRLNLSGCSELEDIQDFAPNLEEIYLAGTSIGELPLSIENLTELVTLDLENCTRLQQLPIRICSLKSIVEVKLSGCTSLQSFPKL